MFCVTRAFPGLVLTIIVMLQYAGACISSFIPNANLLPGTVTIGAPFLRGWHSQFIYNADRNKAQIAFANPVNSANAFGASANMPYYIAAGGRRLLQNNVSMSPLSSNSSSNLFPAGNSSFIQDISTPVDTDTALFSASIPKRTERGMLWELRGLAGSIVWMLSSSL